MWLVFLLYALFASVFTVSKEALHHASPFFLVASRMLIAGIIMLLYQIIKEKQTFHLKKSAWLKITLLALFNIYFTNVFEFWGLQYLTSFKTCFIYSLSPFVSAFLSYLLLQESLTTKKWVGLVVGFCGFIPILMNQTAHEEIGGHLWLFSWPELAVCAAAVSSVYGWILLRQLVQQEGTPPILANSLSMLIGGTIALFHSLYVEEWNPIPVSNFQIVIECTFFLVIISNMICYNLMGYLLKRFSATFMSFAGLTTPLFTALFGFFMHGELTTTSFWISFLFVCFGLVVFYQEELKKSKGLKTTGTHEQLVPT
ncbi:MAG: hypothetical protein JWO53_737 [Chlamydiia bacterium]|nr:hypothetical protein [Chlamydiia bacterium]